MHKHDFKIILREVLPSGEIKITKECDCGKQKYELSASGDWQRV